MAKTKEEALSLIEIDARNPNGDMIKSERDLLFKDILLKKMSEEELIEWCKWYVSKYPQMNAGNGIDSEIREIAILKTNYFHPEASKEKTDQVIKKLQTQLDNNKSAQGILDKLGINTGLPIWTQGILGGIGGCYCLESAIK